MPESVARENAILPLAEEEDALKVIVSDPYDIDTVEKLRFILNRRIEIALAPRDKILEAINKYYSQIEGESADSVLQEFTDTAIDFTETETTAVSAGEVVDENSAPIVRLVQLMINEAVAAAGLGYPRRAVRGNRPNSLPDRRHAAQTRQPAPPAAGSRSFPASKFWPRWTSPNGAAPQDGRIKITVGDKEFDLRVSIIPTNHGQSVVMRILDKDNIKVGVRQLGPVGRELPSISASLSAAPTALSWSPGRPAPERRRPSTPP